VQDCVEAMLTAVEKCDGKVTVLNLGTDEYCEVNDSIAWICEELGARPEVRYGGGDRGWVGDNPFIFLDCSAVRGLGWRPKLTIREGVTRTVRFLRSHPELLDRQ
jgi:UDP-glucose 4-epimerase